MGEMKIFGYSRERERESERESAFERRNFHDVFNGYR